MVLISIISYTRLAQFRRSSVSAQGRIKFETDGLLEFNILLISGQAKAPIDSQEPFKGHLISS